MLENLHIQAIEFKINYFKPAHGRGIICKSRVVYVEKKIIVSESEIYTRSDKEEKMVSKALVTLIAVPPRN